MSENSIVIFALIIILIMITCCYIIYRLIEKSRVEKIQPYENGVYPLDPKFKVIYRLGGVTTKYRVNWRKILFESGCYTSADYILAEVYSFLHEKYKTMLNSSVSYEIDGIFEYMIYGLNIFEINKVDNFENLYMIKVAVGINEPYSVFDHRRRVTIRENIRREEFQSLIKKIDYNFKHPPPPPKVVYYYRNPYRDFY